MASEFQSQTKAEFFSNLKSHTKNNMIQRHYRRLMMNVNRKPTDYNVNDFFPAIPDDAPVSARNSIGGGDSNNNSRREKESKLVEGIYHYMKNDTASLAENLEEYEDKKKRKSSIGISGGNGRQSICKRKLDYEHADIEEEDNDENYISHTHQQQQQHQLSKSSSSSTTTTSSSTRSHNKQPLQQLVNQSSISSNTLSSPSLKAPAPSQTKQLTNSKEKKIKIDHKSFHHHQDEQQQHAPAEQLNHTTALTGTVLKKKDKKKKSKKTHSASSSLVTSSHHPFVKQHSSVNTSTMSSLVDSEMQTDEYIEQPTETIKVFKSNSEIRFEKVPSTVQKPQKTNNNTSALPTPTINTLNNKNSVLNYFRKNSSTPLDSTVDNNNPMNHYQHNQHLAKSIHTINEIDEDESESEMSSSDNNANNTHSIKPIQNLSPIINTNKNEILIKRKSKSTAPANEENHLTKSINKTKNSLRKTDNEEIKNHSVNENKRNKSKTVSYNDCFTSDEEQEDKNEAKASTQNKTKEKLKNNKNETKNSGETKENSKHSIIRKTKNQSKLKKIQDDDDDDDDENDENNNSDDEDKKLTSNKTFLNLSSKKNVTFEVEKSLKKAKPKEEDKSKSRIKETLIQSSDNDDGEEDVEEKNVKNHLSLHKSTASKVSKNETKNRTKATFVSNDDDDENEQIQNHVQEELEIETKRPTTSTEAKNENNKSKSKEKDKSKSRIKDTRIQSSDNDDDEEEKNVKNHLSLHKSTSSKEDKRPTTTTKAKTENKKSKSKKKKASSDIYSDEEIDEFFVDSHEQSYSKSSVVKSKRNTTAIELGKSNSKETHRRVLNSEDKNNEDNNTNKNLLSSKSLNETNSKLNPFVSLVKVSESIKNKKNDESKSKKDSTKETISANELQFDSTMGEFNDADFDRSTNKNTKEAKSKKPLQVESNNDDIEEEEEEDDDEMKISKKVKKNEKAGEQTKEKKKLIKNNKKQTKAKQKIDKDSDDEIQEVENSNNILPPAPTETKNQTLTNTPKISNAYNAYSLNKSKKNINEEILQQSEPSTSTQIQQPQVSQFKQPFTIYASPIQNHSELIGVKKKKLTNTNSKKDRSLINEDDQDEQELIISQSQRFIRKSIAKGTSDSTLAQNQSSVTATTTNLQSSIRLNSNMLKKSSALSIASPFLSAKTKAKRNKELSSLAKMSNNLISPPSTNSEDSPAEEVDAQPSSLPSPPPQKKIASKQSSHGVKTKKKKTTKENPTSDDTSQKRNRKSKKTNKEQNVENNEVEEIDENNNNSDDCLRRSKRVRVTASSNLRPIYEREVLTGFDGKKICVKKITGFEKLDTDLMKFTRKFWRQCENSKKNTKLKRLNTNHEYLRDEERDDEKKSKKDQNKKITTYFQQRHRSTSSDSERQIENNNNSDDNLVIPDTQVAIRNKNVPAVVYENDFSDINNNEISSDRPGDGAIQMQRVKPIDQLSSTYMEIVKNSNSSYNFNDENVEVEDHELNEYNSKHIIRFNSLCDKRVYSEISQGVHATVIGEKEGITRIDEQSTSMPHEHDTDIQYFVQKGCVSIKILGQKNLLNMGDYMIIPKRNKYEISNPSSRTQAFLLFRFDEI